jgi:hypothetical protein
MAFFHAAGNICVEKLKLKIDFSKEGSISEQPFETKLGIISNPTDFVGRIQTPYSLTKAGVKLSIHRETMNCMTQGGALNMLRRSIRAFVAFGLVGTANLKLSPS